MKKMFIFLAALACFAFVGATACGDGNTSTQNTYTRETLTTKNIVKVTPTHETTTTTEETLLTSDIAEADETQTAGAASMQETESDKIEDISSFTNLLLDSLTCEDLAEFMSQSIREDGDSDVYVDNPDSAVRYELDNGICNVNFEMIACNANEDCAIDLVCWGMELAIQTAADEGISIPEDLATFSASPEGDKKCLIEMYFNMGTDAEDTELADENTPNENTEDTQTVTDKPAISSTNAQCEDYAKTYRSRIERASELLPEMFDGMTMSDWETISENGKCELRFVADQTEPCKRRECFEPELECQIFARDANTAARNRTPEVLFSTTLIEGYRCSVQAEVFF